MKIFEFEKTRPGILAEDVTYAKALRLCESISNMLTSWGIKEDDDLGAIEWEPQPQMKGVKGITRDTGVGHRERETAKKEKEIAAMKKAWSTLAMMLKKYQASPDPRAGQKASEIEDRMRELRARGKAAGVNLDGEAFGLAPN